MNKCSSTAIQYTDNALIRKETFELKLTNLRKNKKLDFKLSELVLFRLVLQKIIIS